MLLGLMTESAVTTITRRLAGAVASVADRIVCVIFALLLSQLPQYMTQYYDVLTGAYYESGKTAGDIRKKASKNAVSAEEFVAILVGDAKKIVRDSGLVMKGALERHERYKAAHEALSRSTLFSRPFIFVAYLDLDLTKELKYEPGLPLTLECAVYAGIGLMLGMLISAVLMWWPLKKLVPRPKTV